MESLDDIYWHGAELRQSPMLLWGIGDWGRQFADRLTGWIQAQIPTPELFALFQPEPDQDLARALGLALAPLIEAARKHGRLTSLDVKLIAASWETEEHRLHEVLPVVSQVLGRLLNGNQSITLSLIVPDALGSAEAIERSLQCLEALEELFCELPFLNAAFLYQTQPHAAEGLDAASLDHLSALLRRECFDAELGESIRQNVFPAMGMNRRFNGRKAVYACLGAQALSYSRAELSAHWSAVYTRDVVWGCFNPSATESAKYIRRANLWADDCLELFQRSPASKPVESQRPIWPPSLPDSAALDAFGAGLRDTLEAIKKDEAKRNEDTLTQAAALLEAELAAELDSHSAYLTGGLAFLEAVAGPEELTDEEAGEALPPSGIPRLVVDFVGRPLADAVEAEFKQLQQSLLNEYAKLDLVREGLPDAWIASVANAIPADCEASVNVWKGRFYFASQSLLNAYVKDQAFDASHAEDLFHKLWDSFSKIYNGLLAAIEKNQVGQEQIQQAIETLYASAPWYMKLVYPLTHYKTEENQLKQQLQTILAQAEKLQGLLGALLETCQGIFERIWWPHWLRTLLADALPPVRQKLQDHLVAYIAAIKEASLDLWSEHDTLPVRDTLLETSRPSAEQAKKLYTRMTEDIEWSEHARQVLAHIPATAKPAATKPVSLSEHVKAPPEHLIERTQDYACKLFNPLLSLTLLGITEVDGTNEADAFLQRVDDKLQSYPELSSGLLPVATDQNCLKRLRVIRCTPETQAGLIDHYPHRFGPENRFITTKDPLKIDITLLSFGFSAGLVHLFGHAEIARGSMRLENGLAEPIEPEGSVNSRAKRMDKVHFSVSSPHSVKPGNQILVDVWAHLEQQRTEVLRRVQQATSQTDSPPVIRPKGPYKIERGTTLFVRLKFPDLHVEPLEDVILWEGEIGNASFEVTVPAEITEGMKIGLVTVHWESGLQIARVPLKLLIAATAVPAAPKAYPLYNIHKAFASYASPDRDEVLARIQGMQKIAPDLDVFLDVVKLRSGEDWEQKLWQIIPENDVFYLFWSAAAKASPWVEKEWRCALSSRGEEFIDPVPLVSPEEVQPPDELSKKQFNDWILAYRRGKSKSEHYE